MSNTLKFGNGEWYGKEGTILAYNDENNNYKPLPFNFERDSVATRVNKQGLIETVGADQPRIDYLNDSNGALLLEPSRTNSLPYSSNFSTWSATGGASVVGNKLGVGGSNDAFEFFSDGTANTRLYYSLSNTGELSFSVFAKKNTLDYIALYGNGGSNPRVWFNLANGTLGNQEGAGTGSIESYGNGWYRCTMNWNSASLVNVRIYNSNENDVFGGTTGSVYIQYAQLEEGSYPTSYIPTQGSAVTRLADSCSQTPPDGVIGQTEGVVFFEIDFANTSGVSGAWSISNGSSANRITMNTTNLSSTQFTLSVAQNYNSGSTKLASANVSFSDKHKVAIKYSGTTLKLFVDGQLADSVSTDGFGNYTNFYVGGNQVGVGGDARKFIQADLYNTELTDQELIALTQV